MSQFLQLLHWKSDRCCEVTSCEMAFGNILNLNLVQIPYFYRPFNLTQGPLSLGNNVLTA